MDICLRELKESNKKGSTATVSGTVYWSLMIYEINHIWTAEMKRRWRNDRRSEWRTFLHLQRIDHIPYYLSGLSRALFFPTAFLEIAVSHLPICLNTACAKMFADNTNITISGSSLADLEQETNSELLNLHCWLKANKLSLNIAKTEFMVIGSRQKLLAESHNEINIKLEDQVIKVDRAKSLGLIIDNWLSWSDYVNELCEKVTSAIG